jgi:hypothetical protein
MWVIVSAVLVAGAFMSIAGRLLYSRWSGCACGCMMKSDERKRMRTFTVLVVGIWGVYFMPVIGKRPHRIASKFARASDTTI